MPHWLARARDEAAEIVCFPELSPDDASDELLVVADLDRELLVERRSSERFHPRFRRPEIYASLSEGDIGAQSPR
jgi:predicted amidohydrolase